MEESKKKVYLEFTTNESNGKVYHNYFVNTEIELRGIIWKEKVDMSVAQNDRLSYEILKKIFGTGNKQELNRVTVQALDLATKRRKTTYRYEVRDTDRPSILAILRPANKSAESLLITYFEDVIKFNNDDEEVEEQVINADVVKEEEKKD